MYAIRSYYAVESDLNIIVDLPAQASFGLDKWIEEAGIVDFSKEIGIILTQCVITSYSIHYTKLYEHLTKVNKENEANSKRNHPFKR